MKKIFILLFLVFICIPDRSFASDTNKLQSEFLCHDIKSIDFNNSTIDLTIGTTEPEVISFNSGYARPIEPDTGRSCLEYTILEDRLLRFDRINNIRMLVVNRNMLN